MVKTKRLSVTESLRSEADQIADSAIKGIFEKKGHDPVILDLRNLKNTMADLFIICHGDSDTQVEAIAESVIDQIKEDLGENPVFKEGFENAEWILLDYINVIVHIFRKEQRDYYGIEQFWADAEFSYPTDAA